MSRRRGESMRKAAVCSLWFLCVGVGLLVLSCGARIQDSQAIAVRFFASLNRPADNLQAYRDQFSFSAQADPSGAELCDADDYNGFQYKWSRLQIQRVALGPLRPLDRTGLRDELEVLAYAGVTGTPKVYAALFSMQVLSNEAGGRVVEIVASPSRVSPTAEYLGKALCFGR
jgi:hypothetical protein